MTTGIQVLLVQPRKGNYTPHQAGMRLLWEPKRPRVNCLVVTGEIPAAWKGLPGDLTAFGHMVIILTLYRRVVSDLESQAITESPPTTASQPHQIASAHRPK